MGWAGSTQSAHNRALHLTAISLHSKSAGEPGPYMAKWSWEKH